MAFTDDDLKRFKETSKNNIYPYSRPSFKALLVRLEMAEILANELANIHGHSGPGDFSDAINCVLCPKIKAWSHRGREMTELPEWIKEIKKRPREKYWNCSEEILCQALAIAWEALECVNTFSNDPQLIKENKDALRRIEEIGK